MSRIRYTLAPGLVILFSAIAMFGQAAFGQAETAVEQESLEKQPGKPTATVTPWGGLTVRRLGVEVKDATHIVVLMHGFGASGQDLVPLSKAIAVANTTCFLVPEAPNKLARGGRAWFTKPGEYEASRIKVVELLKYVNQTNPNAKLILGGFSQGAMLASNFLEKDADLVAALILLSPSGQLHDDVTGTAKHKPAVFLAHGRDDRVLPFEGSKALHEKLVGFKYQVDWMPFDGPHTIPNEVVAGISKFMEKIQKK